MAYKPVKLKLRPKIFYEYTNDRSMFETECEPIRHDTSFLTDRTLPKPNS